MSSQEQKDAEIKFRDEREKLIFLRGSILRALADPYPDPMLHSSLMLILMGEREEIVEQELRYMIEEGWINSKPIKMLGRGDRRLCLTKTGYNVYRGIDPEKPFAPEEG